MFADIIIMKSRRPWPFNREFFLSTHSVAHAKLLESRFYEQRCGISISLKGLTNFRPFLVGLSYKNPLESQF